MLVAHEIAVSVAKANAVLFSQLPMSPGHTMDSNTDQSVAAGHCGVFVVMDFLRKGDVLMVTRIDRLARASEHASERASLHG